MTRRLMAVLLSLLALAGPLPARGEEAWPPVTIIGLEDAPAQAPADPPVDDTATVIGLPPGAQPGGPQEDGENVTIIGDLSGAGGNETLPADTDENVTVIGDVIGEEKGAQAPPEEAALPPGAEDILVHLPLIEDTAPRLTVPDTLAFETVALSTRDQLSPRAQADWRIAIDNPQGIVFSLYARMDAPLTSASGDALPEGIVFAQGGGITPLYGGEVLIASGAGSMDIGWPAGEGLLARLAGYRGIPDEAYTATITWSLVMGP